MRKVYHNESSSLGLVMSVICSVGLTVLLFGSLPFAHRIGEPDDIFELRDITTAELDEPEEEQEPEPEPAAEQPADAPPEPELADTPQDIPLSADLEVALGSGSGALEGYGEISVLTVVQATGEETFSVEDLERRPVAVSQVAPNYPPELRKARIGGLVTVTFVLNQEGRVEDPRVENSSRQEFEKPALDAIRKWRFQPGMKDGQPVRSYLRQPIRFQVNAG